MCPRYEARSETAQLATTDAAVVGFRSRPN